MRCSGKERCCAPSTTRKTHHSPAAALTWQTSKMPQYRPASSPRTIRDGATSPSRPAEARQPTITSHQYPPTSRTSPPTHAGHTGPLGQAQLPSRPRLCAARPRPRHLGLILYRTSRVPAALPDVTHLPISERMAGRATRHTRHLDRHPRGLPQPGPRHRGGRCLRSSAFATLSPTTPSSQHHNSAPDPGPPLLRRHPLFPTAAVAEAEVQTRSQTGHGAPLSTAEASPSRTARYPRLGAAAWRTS